MITNMAHACFTVSDMEKAEAVLRRRAGTETRLRLHR